MAWTRSARLRSRATGRCWPRRAVLEAVEPIAANRRVVLERPPDVRRRRPCRHRTAPRAKTAPPPALRLANASRSSAGARCDARGPRGPRLPSPCRPNPGGAHCRSSSLPAGGRRGFWRGASSLPSSGPASDLRLAGFSQSPADQRRLHGLHVEFPAGAESQQRPRKGVDRLVERRVVPQRQVVLRLSESAALNPGSPANDLAACA